MKIQLNHKSTRSALLLSTIAIALLSSAPQASPQNPQVQERLAAVKESAAANKKALAQYTWMEQQTTSIKGEVKKTQQFQVSIGPDGQQQKTPLNAAPPPQQPSGGRLKRHVVEKKTEEFQDYGQQIAALAKQYTTPDPDKLQQAYQQGNVSMQPDGANGTVNLIIKNYVKPNDQVTIVFNKQQKAIQSLQISTYLSDPKDAVTISAQFAKLPDGTNHVTSTLINGVSKQLTVATQNTNYQHI
jgi:hypothetical protein